MVEKIIVNPDSIRCYGNIVKEHGLGDYSTYMSSATKTSETINGLTTSIYNLFSSLYGFILGFDDGAKQLYLQAEEDDSLSLGFDSMNKQLYVVNDTEETINFSFDSMNKQLYIQVGE